MKYGIIVVMLSALMCALTAHAVTVDGNVFLSGRTDHSGTRIIFRAVSPTAATDSTVSSGDGYYSLMLQRGVYDVEFSQSGYASYSAEDMILFYDSTLNSVTLMEGIFGFQNGSFGPGSFEVIDTLRIATGQTWTLAPGTRLFFRPKVPLIVNGTLSAQGSYGDSILFTPSFGFTDSAWGGLHFLGASSAGSLNHCIIEGGRGKFLPEYTVFYDMVGAISSYNCDPLFEHCTIRRNPYTESGGGAFCWGGAPTFRDCSFSENNAGYGSALALYGTFAVVEKCTFTDNYQSTIYMAGGQSPLITNCVITSMHKGITVVGSNATIDRTVIQALIAFETNGGNPRITRSTLVGATHLNSGRPLVNSSILACTNLAELPILTILSGVVAEIKYCAWYAPWGGTVMIQSNIPAFRIIAFTNANGDSCDTYYNIFFNPLFEDFTAGDYRLLGESPCIDAGDPYLPLDPDGTISDIGAFYFDHLDATPSERMAVRGYGLYQNYPNPFNGQTTIRYELRQAGPTTLRIYNLLGQEVATVVNEMQTAGAHNVNFAMNDLASGVYVYRLESGDFRETRKLMLMK